MFQNALLRDTLLTMVFALAVTYGVVSGALLLAGESDDGTVYFLDALAGRGALWQGKCLAGVLFTIALSLVLIALSLGLGFMSWPVGFLLLLLSLEAFAWGLLAGALCQRVLPAVLTAIAFLAGSWIVFTECGLLFVPILWEDSPFWFSVAKIGAAVTAAYGSWRCYSAVDRLRQPNVKRPRPRRFSLLPSSGSVLLWLILRQGRLHLAVIGVGTILLAFSANVVFWPIGALVLGLLCGLPTFMDDQKDGVRFLGAQRFPPGIIWGMKIGFWGVVLLAMITVAWFTNVLALLSHDSDSGMFQSWKHTLLFQRWIGTERMRLINPLIFLGIWPLYGFCFAQYFAQVMPRPVVGGILAFLVAPLVGVWIPSQLFGGLSLWQVLVVPVLLLLLTRINQRSWLMGRLLVGKPLVVLLGGAVLVVVGLAGSLWYRVLEIPNVGEPFDVQAFEATIPSPEQNEAGRLIRRASELMWDQRGKVTAELSPPTVLNRPGGRRGGGAAGGGGVPPGGAPPGGKPMPAAPPGGKSYVQPPYENPNVLTEIVDKGWPQQDQEMARWLDRVFEGAWAQIAEKVARMPLGMIADPRRVDRVALEDPGRVGRLALAKVYSDCDVLAKLFTVRALQLLAHGDAGAALKHLETALGLTRQMKNYTISKYLPSVSEAERNVLLGYRLWLHNVPRDKALLRDALAMLQRHEAANPDLDNAIKSNYLFLLHDEPVFRGDAWIRPLFDISYQVPWEKERLRRLARAFVAGQLRASQQPFWDNPNQRQQKDKNYNRDFYEALFLDLPPKNGPGSHLSVAAWAAFLHEFNLNWPITAFWIPLESAPINISIFHAAELATALALYQVDHGTPETGAVVVPEYLAALPDDPVSGKPPGYRISKGEKLKFGQQEITLVPGQGIVSCSWILGNFPLPHWKK